MLSFFICEIHSQVSIYKPGVINNYVKHFLFKIIYVRLYLLDISERKEENYEKNNKMVNSMSGSLFYGCRTCTNGFFYVCE